MKKIAPKTSAERSAVMRAVRSKNTQPELIVRAIVRSLALRYRLHAKNLPGQPDIVFPSLKKAIFVHGCFWHGHHCRRGNRQPKTNTDYWMAKIAGNARRDAASRRALNKLGWKTKIIWECSLSEANALTLKIMKFLAS